VQRLFTAFPSGAPGLGLLLLRVAVALALFEEGAAGLLEGAVGTSAWFVGALAAVAGVLLILGLVTPVSGAMGAAAAASLALSALAPPTRSGMGVSTSVALAAAALALIGPGAFSVDAALFGRREIAIPRRPKSD
jgi:uncharacterized membrane protein YphA (DoxX/SURF4 family)